MNLQGLAGERAAYDRHVAGRSIGYLDTDVWICLTFQKGPAARRCRALAERAVRERRVIFPLSYASCSELVQQVPGESRAARIRLMQQLSEGIAFRDLSTILKIEAEAALPIALGEEPTPPDLSRMFAGVFECFSDAVDLLSGIEEIGRNPRFVSWLRTTGRLMSLDDYVRAFDSLGEFATSEHFFEERAHILRDSIREAADACRNGDGSVNRRKAFLQEALSCFRTISPILVGVLREQRPEAAATFGARARGNPGNLKRLRQLFEAMPSAGNRVDLFVGRVMNAARRHKGRNDFWDVEHAMVPGAYADAWVTLDQGLARLVRGCDTPRRQSVRIISDIEGLSSWLSDTIAKKAATAA